MKIYTKTGDDGTTGLFAGPRVRKDDLRIEAYGAVDELNATLGVVRTHQLSGDLDELLAAVQSELFDVGAELATPDPKSCGLATVGERQIERLERAIDLYQASLPPLKQFILPAGTPSAAALHVARTVCRAERRLVSLIAIAQPPVPDEVLVYLNRLSDLLFVLARAANAAAGQPDVFWKKSS